jgi:hypothetical protein
MLFIHANIFPLTKISGSRLYFPVQEARAQALGKLLHTTAELFRFDAMFSIAPGSHMTSTTTASQEVLVSGSP